ncbi:MAG TPA: nicotinamide riboside transporter PnuC, partial [Herpetosiphonaceae bacterium]|nr:nicotinamide riboside transporter PnuC [Herpetosiphonaceae bacterium]
NLHIWLPDLFPEPASFAYLDALTTIMSFVATILMARKRIECWVYWIAVDVIGIGLYYAKDVKFIALLYVIFLALAIAGLFAWIGKGRQKTGRAASAG